MMKFNYVAILLMMTITCFMTVYSIKCYQCRSDLEKDCEFSNKKYLRECIGTTRNFGYNFTALKRVDNQYYLTDNLCRQIDQSLRVGRTMNFTVIRECATIHSGQSVCYSFTSKEFSQKTCDCARDGCNTGTSISNRKPMTILILYISLNVILWIFN